MGSVATVLKRHLMVRCPWRPGGSFGATACVSAVAPILDLILFFPLFILFCLPFLDFAKYILFLFNPNPFATLV